MTPVDVPHWFDREIAAETWCKDSNWMGYVAVSTDEESERIGRRDIVVAWRGTSMPCEWFADIRTGMVRLDQDHKRVKVAKGFLSIFTSKSDSSKFNKLSAFDQVIKELTKQPTKQPKSSLTSSFSVISFAAPRVGNIAFKERLCAMGVNTLRVVVKQDIVPRLPGFEINSLLTKLNAVARKNALDVSTRRVQLRRKMHWMFRHVGVQLRLDVSMSPYLKDDFDITGYHNLEIYLHLVDGYYSKMAKFRMEARRDLALVNKSTDMLLEKLRIPERWYQMPNKGLVCNSFGRWVKPKREPLDLPSPLGQPASTSPPESFVAASGAAKTSFLGSLPAGVLQVRLGFKPSRKSQLAPCIKCEKKDKDEPFKEYWPEGTASRVRAARAPEPTAKSEGVPSFGKSPGSRRRKNKTAPTATGSSQATVELSDNVATDSLEDEEEYQDKESPDGSLEESKELLSDYVLYQTESKGQDPTEFDLNKEIGRPHPFIDPKVKKPKPEQISSDELWWNWRKPDKEQWSRWQRRRPDSETMVKGNALECDHFTSQYGCFLSEGFSKAMAETGQVKIYGEEPTLTETSLYRARRHIFKEERLQAERERLTRDGPLAYYSEWVKAWKKDTSREAVQKHFEETGEDENTQLIEMSINYTQDPDEIIDFRGPDFHEPTPDMLDFLKEHGKIISREELDKILAKEKKEEIEMTDMDDAMARAVDIGENEDEEEDSEVEVDEDADEKLPRNWSVLKSTPELRKTKDKPKKKGAPLALDDAVDESENLTDFLMDFEEDDE
ncbi:unnamed protein product [Rhodiola kirilowii]